MNKTEGMNYKVAYKQATRLQRKNWHQVVREAHRLASMGLPVLVSEARISLASVTHDVTIYEDGGIEYCSGYGDTACVARVLEEILEDAQKVAADLAAVASAMAKSQDIYRRDVAGDYPLAEVPNYGNDDSTGVMCAVVPVASTPFSQKER